MGDINIHFSCPQKVCCE